MENQDKIKVLEEGNGGEELPHQYKYSRSEDDINKMLISCEQSILPWKDFHAEVRALLDIHHLLARCTVLLNVRETNASEIFQRLVEEVPTACLTGIPVFEGKGNGSEKPKMPPPILYSRVKEEIFCAKNGKNCDLRQHLQNLVFDEKQQLFRDQSFFVVYASLENISENRVMFARLSVPTNFGPGMEEIRFVLLVIAPHNQKCTKSALEVARTFATLFSVSELRNRLFYCEAEQEFLEILFESAQERCLWDSKNAEKNGEKVTKKNELSTWYFGRGVLEDFSRRFPHYKDDFVAGIRDTRSIQKTISTALFLFCIVLPTAISLGQLNEESTHGKINLKKVILGQWIGGLFFGLFGGQLFLIIVTSPPIAIYIRVVEHVSHSSGYDFFQLYAGIGTWCCVYLAIFACVEAAALMKFAKRSLEELFSMFIACTLVIESLKATNRMMNRATLPHCVGVHGSKLWEQQNETLTTFLCNQTVHPVVGVEPHPHGIVPPPPPNADGPPFPPPPPHFDPLSCNHSVGLLFILLMLGTEFVSVWLLNFRSTPFMTARKRELLSDYALVLGVSLMAFVANEFFGDVPKETCHYHPNSSALTFGAFWELEFSGQLICAVLGFPLAILFCMDQMIVTSTVDNNQNKLKKGPAPNWDFLIVSILNVPLSLFGLPWMHGALPQSFLHLRSQADIEDQVVDGIVKQVIVKNRESRLATLLAHTAMVPAFFWLLPHVRLFPTSVFNGVFLFLAYTASNTEFCERIRLLFTDQRCYPPTHYVRQVPQRVIHCFTLTELAQLGLLLCIGHSPLHEIRLLFPLALISFIPLRYYVFPKFFDQKYLDTIDGIH